MILNIGEHVKFRLWTRRADADVARCVYSQAVCNPSGVIDMEFITISAIYA